jgi:hypothetical protein
LIQNKEDAISVKPKSIKSIKKATVKNSAASLPRANPSEDPSRNVTYKAPDSVISSRKSRRSGVSRAKSRSSNNDLTQNINQVPSVKKSNSGSNHPDAEYITSKHSSKRSLKPPSKAKSNSNKPFEDKKSQNEIFAEQVFDDPASARKSLNDLK